ncbi:MAG: outer membrane lipoprotein carrier protein LolA [Pseudomonadota bacterium]
MFKFLLTIFLICAGINQSLAKTNQDFLNQNKSDLTSIENYLNNIKFLNANFTQQASNGEVSNGKFLLSRPGKMRVEYDKPTPVRIIANGSVLAYTDLELDETSYLSTNSTPASFLTRKNFSFAAKDVEITDFEKSADSIRVGIVKKNKKEAGTFTLIFKTNPLRFVKMEVKNDLDEITKVSFTTVKFDEAIDDKMFIVKNKNLPE